MTTLSHHQCLDFLDLLRDLHALQIDFYMDAEDRLVFHDPHENLCPSLFARIKSHHADFVHLAGPDDRLPHELYPIVFRREVFDPEPAYREPRSPRREDDCEFNGIFAECGAKNIEIFRNRGDLIVQATRGSITASFLEELRWHCPHILCVLPTQKQFQELQFGFATDSPEPLPPDWVRYRLRGEGSKHFVEEPGLTEWDTDDLPPGVTLS